MKPLLIFLFLFSVAENFTVYAQESTPVVEVKAHRNTYLYKQSETRSDALMTVTRKNSFPAVYSTKGLQFLRPSNIEYAVAGSVSKSMHEVFSVARMNELSAERIFLEMYVDYRGKIIALNFFVNVNTKMVVSEFEMLEEAVKRNVSFKLAKDDKKEEGVLAPFTHGFTFKRVLDGTLPD